MLYFHLPPANSNLSSLYVWISVFLQLCCLNKVSFLFKITNTRTAGPLTEPGVFGAATFLSQPSSMSRQENTSTRASNSSEYRNASAKSEKVSDSRTGPSKFIAESSLSDKSSDKRNQPTRFLNKPIEKEGLGSSNMTVLLSNMVIENQQQYATALNMDPEVRWKLIL